MSGDRLAWGLVLGGALAGGLPAQAQIPDKYTNLQVLAKDISRDEIVRTMRDFAGGLGVRCHHCHVGPDNLEGMDFASDEKPTKRAAREMMRMVRAINSGTIAALPPREAPRQQVSCLHCHRRAAVPPPPLDVELARVAEARGAEAAVERYRELRREHHGDGQYDFGVRSLSRAAFRLVDAERLEAALVLARLNLEHFPDVAGVHVVMGEILARRGEQRAAADAFKRALALEPDNGQARRGLSRLEAAAPR